MSKRVGFVEGCLVLIIPVLVIVMFLFGTLVTVLNQEDVTFTVTDKERVQYDDDSKYLVWTDSPDGSSEVFENTDTLLFGKFNSSDVYGEMKIGDVCSAHVVGLRIPFFSMYRNITEVTCSP